MANFRPVYDLIEQYLPVGWLDIDIRRVKRAKSAFVLTMIVLIVYTVVLALSPGRSTAELIVDGYVIVLCLAGVGLLHVTRSLAIAYGTVVATGLTAIAAFYFLHGNRDGEMLFVFLIPVAAVAFLGARRSVPYLIATLAAAALILIIDPLLPRTEHAWHVSPLNPRGWLFHAPDKHTLRYTEALTLFTIAAVVYALSHSGAQALQAANRQVDSLLVNVLPRKIADRLLAAGDQTARNTLVDHYDAVTILFADIVGFTQLSKTLSASELVVLLNELFSRFDHLAAEHQVEKIKTIGDAYMAVCGLPEADARHAERSAELALAMLQAMDEFNQETGHDITLRIGLNSGPVVAGVIGRDKFIYDLWGDAVNVASRMESHGRPGRIHLTEATKALLVEGYRFKRMGRVQLKGQPAQEAWELEGRG